MKEKTQPIMFAIPEQLVERMKETDLLFAGWQMGLPLDKTKQYRITPDKAFLIEIENGGHNENIDSKGAAS